MYTTIWGILQGSGDFTLRAANLDFIVEVIEGRGVGFRKGVPPYGILTVIFDRTCSVLLNTCHTTPDTKIKISNQFLVCMLLNKRVNLPYF